MDFSSFISEHIIYVIIFLVLFVAYTIVEIKVSKSAGFRLSVKESVNLLNQKNTLVFDLRSAKDFQKGHISQARNISKLDLLNKAKNVIKNKGSNVLLISEKDSLSTQTVSSLRKKGFKNIKFIGGGMHAWLKEQMPISKGSAIASSNKKDSKKKRPAVIASAKR
jgi:rhodanese-related sulfurtransferase